MRAGLKTEKTKRPEAQAAQPEEIVAKPVNEKELLELLRRPAHSDQVSLYVISLHHQETQNRFDFIKIRAMQTRIATTCSKPGTS